MLLTPDELGPPPALRLPPVGVYDRAREALAERGHMKGGYIDRDTGRICLMAALAVGCGAETNGDIIAQMFSPTQEMTDAILGLGETITPGVPGLYTGPETMRMAHSAICNFNNTPGADPDGLLQRAAERYA